MSATSNLGDNLQQRWTLHFWGLCSLWSLKPRRDTALSSLNSSLLHSWIPIYHSKFWGEKRMSTTFVFIPTQRVSVCVFDMKLKNFPFRHTKFLRWCYVTTFIRWQSFVFPLIPKVQPTETFAYASQDTSNNGRSATIMRVIWTLRGSFNASWGSVCFLTPCLCCDQIPNATTLCSVSVCNFDSSFLFTFHWIPREKKTKNDFERPLKKSREHGTAEEHWLQHCLGESISAHTSDLIDCNEIIDGFRSGKLTFSFKLMATC